VACWTGDLMVRPVSPSETARFAALLEQHQAVREEM
jgi:hypothetical protein